MQKLLIVGVLFVVMVAAVGTQSIYNTYAASAPQNDAPVLHAAVTPPPVVVVSSAQAPVPVHPTPSAALPAREYAAPAPTRPTALRIPSIALEQRVIPVGLTKDGAMDVPSGTTSDVGWYRYGPVPGTRGSAVLDAHVFAAFARLHKVKVGNDIYVRDVGGRELHFVVRDVQLYALADVPAEVLFKRTDTERLNLITCAGTLTADRSTYTHRLVVYATLAQ